MIIVKKINYELQKDESTFKALENVHSRFDKDSIEGLMLKYRIPFRILKQMIKEEPDNYELEDVYDDFITRLFNITNYKKKDDRNSHITRLSLIRNL